MAITGQTQSKSAVAFKRLQHDHPEVTANSSDFKFRSRGQRDTPVTDVRGIVEIIMLLPGQQAARVRRQAAELLVRYLGGDMRIIDEVCALRGLQEELATARPDDPRRIFGEAVEASGSHGPVGEQLVRIISTVERRLTVQESFVRNGLSIRTGFGITYHSERLRNNLPFGMASESPQRAPWAHPPKGAEGALAPPPGSHWMKSWSISAGLSRPSSPVSFHGMPLQVWMVRPWMFAAIEFWNAKPTNWTL